MLVLLHLPQTVQQLLPGISPWVDSLAVDPTARTLQDWFAEIEVVHFLGLFMLMACVILTSLRLAGLGLVEAPASTVYRNTRIWLHIGVIVAIGSGLMMGLSNASKLYNNTAFLWKMIAMIAAIIFSYAVMVPSAKADGQAGGRVKVALTIALVLWALAFLIMQTNKGANVGIVHLMFATALISVLALTGRARLALLIGLALWVLALQIMTHLIFKDSFAPVFTTVNKVWMWVTAVLIFGVALANILGLDARKDSTALMRFAGYATILVWVTVAAGGRWIGFT
jgi:hypothetical protein